MKKSAFVVLLVGVFVLAIAATALANTTSGYIAWNSAAPNNTPPTPHKGYALTTTKCIVCHAAHKADSDGEILLADTVANACVFCHIGTGPSSVKVYNSDSALYTSGNDQAHNNACSQCHAVHGANTITQTTDLGLNQKILRTDTGTDQTSPALPGSFSMAAGATDRAGVVSGFCTQCHPYYTGTYAVSTTTGDITYNSAAYNSHIMTSDFALYGPANGGNAAANVNAKVAYASSAYCTSCHDDGADTAANNFPHYTAGARFMKAATAVGASTSGAVEPYSDGVCLKCHIEVGGTAGVGIGF